MSRPAPPLRSRLVVGNLVLILTALAVTWAVATVAGPPLFRDHIDHKSGLAPAVLDRVEQAFHVANLLQVLLASVLALALTLGANLLISRTISARIGEITAGTADIAAGNYATRLPQRRTSRELDTLTSAVNEMAATLQHTEATRGRLLTDIAHELRTPIATIDGYLEGIEDGVEAADTQTIALLRRQVRRLTRLAEDPERSPPPTSGAFASSAPPCRSTNSSDRWCRRRSRSSPPKTSSWGCSQTATPPSSPIRPGSSRS